MRVSTPRPLPPPGGSPLTAGNWVEHGANWQQVRILSVFLQASDDAESQRHSDLSQTTEMGKWRFEKRPKMSGRPASRPVRLADPAGIVSPRVGSRIGRFQIRNRAGRISALQTGLTIRLVIFNNHIWKPIPPRAKLYEAYVKPGCGLLVIGGETERVHRRQERRGSHRAALTGETAPSALPGKARCGADRRQVSSMEGRKMELLACAIGVNRECSVRSTSSAS